MTKNKNKLLLCILDGWGYSTETRFNAIHQAKTPYYDNLLLCNPHTLIRTAGKSVGLPEGQMGNSEVGHKTIGAGRIIKQDLLKIDQMLQDPEQLKNNATLNSLISKTKNKTCHILALISDGKVHSDIEHVIKIGKYLKGKKIKVLVHAFTDGRDTKPRYAQKFIRTLIDNNLSIATISGRYFAMDRDSRWDRIAKVYETIIFAQKNIFSDVISYVNDHYARGIGDEFIEPASSSDYSGFEDGDSMFFTNFRADRIVQLVKSLIGQKRFFSLQVPVNFSYLASISEYSQELNNFVKPVITKSIIENYMGEHISEQNLTQLKIAETEKYAHVTYFLNCGNHEALPGEKKILIPSPLVDYYDSKPEMSAYKVTEVLIKAMKDHHYDFTCVNFANADMVGHTGNFAATVKACEAVDLCLAKIGRHCQSTGTELLITADHGNAEEMVEDNDITRPITAHSTNDVPLIYIGCNKKIRLVPGGLSDIAPTILKLLRIKIPEEMTGRSLIRMVREKNTKK